MSPIGASPGGGPIVVVGDVMTDVMATVDDPMAIGSDTPARVQTRQGGAGANVAHWLADLGAPVAFVGRVGADPFGREAVQVLAAAGVDVRAGADPTAATGTCVVLVGHDGERTMLPDAGANSLLATEHLPSDLLATASHVHVSGYSLLNPGSRAAAVAVLAAAHEAGATTSVDPASAAPLETVGGKEFLAMTHGTDLALVTLDEAEVLCGSREPVVACARLTATYGEVVLKLGTRGAVWSSANDPAGVGVPAITPEADVVDTTGAGDAFAAAYLAAWRAGLDPADRLRAGCALAAQVVTRLGARPSHQPDPH